MAAAPLAASGLHFIQSKPCSSMNWFNLAKMLQHHIICNITLFTHDNLITRY